MGIDERSGDLSLRIHAIEGIAPAHIARGTGNRRIQKWDLRVPCNDHGDDPKL